MPSTGADPKLRDQQPNHVFDSNRPRRNVSFGQQGGRPQRWLVDVQVGPVYTAASMRMPVEGQERGVSMIPDRVDVAHNLDFPQFMSTLVSKHAVA